MRVNQPESWKTSYRIVGRTLVVPFISPHAVISSAVSGGGLVYATGIINHQVDLHPIADNRVHDPGLYLRRVAKQVGVEGRCVGLMTGVDMRCLVLKRAMANGIWVEGFFTVGVANAARAGEPTLDRNFQDKVGTINIIVITNSRLSKSAMVNAVSVATESKTATLMDECIMNASGTYMATGTGTDVVAVVSGNGPYCRYSGTHTKVGELIGRVVNTGVKEGLIQDRVWRKK